MAPAAAPPAPAAALADLETDWSLPWGLSTMTIPDAAPAPAPSIPPTTAQTPHLLRCCRYSHPPSPPATNAVPANATTDLISPDFSPMDSSLTQVRVSAEASPHAPATRHSGRNRGANIVIFPYRMQLASKSFSPQVNRLFRAGFRQGPFFATRTPDLATCCGGSRLDR